MFLDNNMDDFYNGKNMDKEKIIIIQEMYESCLKSRNDEYISLKNNLNRIEEINSYLSTVRSDINSDYDIFSPRKEKNYFEDKIIFYEKEKSILEKNNQIITLNIEKIDKQLNQLDKLLENSNNSDSNHKIKQLNYYDILSIQEKERQRISRELHDSSIQNLTHLVHMIELSLMYIDQDPIKAKLELEDCIRLLKSTIDEVRNTVFNLRPMTFDDLGFKQCIENLIANEKSQFKNFDIECNICELTSDNFDSEDKEKNDILLLMIYRIIQEALINALKHSNGDKIILDFKAENNQCFIEIIDNGKGFSLDHQYNKKDKHFGILIMKERIELLGGQFTIDTEPEKGTDIKIQIPLIVNQEEILL